MKRGAARLVLWVVAAACLSALPAQEPVAPDKSAAEPAVKIERLYVSSSKIEQGEGFRIELRLGADAPWLLTAPPPAPMGRAPGEIALPARLRFQKPPEVEMKLTAHSPDGIRDWRDESGQLRYGSRGITFRFLARQREPLKPGEHWFRVTARSMLMTRAGEAREEVMVFRFPVEIVPAARRRLPGSEGVAARITEDSMFVAARYVVESVKVIEAEDAN